MTDHTFFLDLLPVLQGAATAEHLRRDFTRFCRQRLPDWELDWCEPGQRADDLAVPIGSHGQHGGLCIRKRDGGALDRGQRSLAETLAGMLGLALDAATAERRPSQPAVELTSGEQTAQQQLLAQSAVAFVEHRPDEDLFELIAGLLERLAPMAFVAVSEFDPETRELVCRVLHGVGERMTEVMKLLGRHPVGMRFSIPPALDEEFKQGRLVLLPDGLHDLTFGRLPRPASLLLERLLGIGEVFALPFVRGDEIFGTAMLGIRRGAALDARTAQTLILQASVALQRHKAMQRARQLQEQLFQAQKMEAIGQLAGGMAHDFNNMLTGIAGNAELALLEVGESGPVGESLVEVLVSARKAAHLTRQLLAFSSKQVVTPRVVDVNRILDGLDRMIIRLIGENIRIERRYADELAPVRADPVQLEQVVLNLMVNARDAMPDGGRVVIETRMLVHEPAESHPAEPAADRVRISVSDDGVGMDVATRKRVFEPFFTTKGPGKGTGLGLATAYGIVHQFQGHIALESAPGRGTTFHIDLPALAADVEPDAPERLAVGGGAGSEIVLVVEDDDVVRRIAVRSLERRGYRVAQASGGLQALELIDSGELVPELLVTDVIMPGMDGKALAEELQARLPALHVLYTSGYEDETVARHGVLEPGLAFLAKPYSPEQLAGKVRAVLDGRES